MQKKSVTRWQSGLGLVTLMVGIGLTLTAILWLLGVQRTALAVLAVLPLSLFQTWLTTSAIMNGGSSARVVLRTSARTVLSIVAVAIASYYGTGAMVGVLIGLNLEIMSHLVYGVHMILRR